MSALIVGILMAVALNAAGASARSQVDNGDRARALLVATSLLAEILAQPYEDPSGNAVFGLEADESSATRNDFDDVDDYHNLSSPPKTKQGTDLPNTTGLTSTVQVSFANPSDLREGAAGTVPQLKWVTVRVRRGATVVATSQAVVAK